MVCLIFFDFCILAYYEVSDLLEKLNIGGQAVLEGVMMRSPHAFTVAVRKGGKPAADIVVLQETIQPLGERYPLFKKKIIRGSFGCSKLCGSVSGRSIFRRMKLSKAKTARKKTSAPLLWQGL